MSRPSPEAAFRRFLPSGLRRPLVRSVYDFLSNVDPAGEVTLHNFGFAPVTGAVSRSNERNRLQLYEEVASAVPLSGRDVLEVSCGRGGGAVHVAAHHAPKSFIGLDLSQRAITFCAARHRAPGLAFCVGEAEALPFQAARFDAVLNVEAAMNYGSIDAFASEVRRVLRPGGHLLFADQCARSDVAELRRRLAPRGMIIDAARDLTANVVDALDAQSDSILRIIGERVPRALRPLVRQFAGVPGSIVYRRFRSGALQYWNFTVRREG